MADLKLQTVEKEFKPDGERYKELAQQVVKLDTVEEVETATKFQKEITGKIKDLEEKRKSITGPINESLKNINAAFKEISTPFIQAKALIAGVISAWHVAEEKRIREENAKIAAEEARRRKIQEAHAKKGHKVAETPYIPREVAKPNKVGAGHVRKTWVFDLVDYDKVPRNLTKIDEQAVNREIALGRRQIPGLTIYQKTTSVTR